MKCNRVNIILTHRCNLNCKHCYMNASYNVDEDFDKIFLSAKQLLLTLFDGGVNEIMFTGGECTTFPHIVELVKYAKDIGFGKVDIFTNGMILNKELFDLVDACYLSIDGLEHNHNFVRGNNYSFKNLLKTLDYLKEIDKITYLQFTANNYNVDDLYDISKMLISYLNVRKVKIVNQSNEGRALNSELEPINLYKIKDMLPILYENTNYHIQFLSDLWSRYDVANYYLNTEIILPIWFDLVDNEYYIYTKDCFVNSINKFDMTELQDKLKDISLEVTNHFKTKLEQQYMDVESTLANMFKKEE
ncbi:MAG: radical SAM protein [Clostridia bacterium]|nr:radical SAM protein [Clostridia bacterium]